MITRDFGDAQIVTAFDLHKFASSGVSTTLMGDTIVCATGGPNPVGGFDAAWTGYMIDRMGLRRNYANALVVPAAALNPQFCASSTVAGDKCFGLGYGLQHATATGGTWKNLSTECWTGYQQLLYQTTTTSTGAAAGFYVNRDSAPESGLAGFVSTAGDCTTSSGLFRFVSQGGGLFDLTGAGRYLRVVIAPTVPTNAIATTCHAALHVMASLVFGGASLGPSSADIFRSRIYVTCGCSTST